LIPLLTSYGAVVSPFYRVGFQKRVVYMSN